MCCACARTLMLALFKYEKRISFYKQYQTLALEAQSNQTFEG